MWSVVLSIILLIIIMIPNRSFAWIVTAPPGSFFYAIPNSELKWKDNSSSASFRRSYPFGEIQSGGKMFLNYIIRPPDKNLSSNMPTALKILNMYVTAPSTGYACFNLRRVAVEDDSTATYSWQLDSSASTNLIFNISTANVVVQPQGGVPVNTSLPNTFTGYGLVGLEFERVSCNSRCTGPGNPYACCNSCTDVSGAVEFHGLVLSHD